jgi:hypothetical protein
MGRCSHLGSSGDELMIGQGNQLYTGLQECYNRVMDLHNRVLRLVEAIWVDACLSPTWSFHLCERRPLRLTKGRAQTLEEAPSATVEYGHLCHS